MRVYTIDSSALPIIEYRHIHDATIVLRKYRENFNFGLITNQYYFNKKLKDKKTNFNTQYTLTDLQALSTIAELDIPFTTDAVSAFTTTIKHGDKYLKNDYTDLNNIQSTFVNSSQFSNLSSQFFFTFHISSIPSPANNLNKRDAAFITQDYNSKTYYLSAPYDQNITAKWTLIASGDNNRSWLSYTLNDNKITLHNNATTDNDVNVGIGTTAPGAANVLINNSDTLYLSAPGAWQNTIADLSASFFDVNRNLLTKDFKTLPNTFNKYKSSANVDNVSLTNVTSVSNNYFVFNNNYNFYQDNSENKFIAHVDFFPLKNQATLHEYYSENNHYNYEANTNNRIYEKINAGVHQQHGYNNIGLSYNIGTYDITFKPNKLTYFTTPNSMSPYTVLNINDSKIENLGAVPGSNPLMSDKVFKRREIIKNNNFSDDVNPMYLCSWLSGNSDGDTRWVDRYYNPLASNFSDALSGTSHYNVITAAGAQTTETFDVSSSLTFEPNNDYGYYHVGGHDYENLFRAYLSKYNKTTHTEYLDYKGVPLPRTYVKKDREIILDGNNLAKNKTDIQGDFSINFWLHTKDNTKPFCYKLLGNYFDDGIGVFNTDLVTPNIILPVSNTTDKNSTSKLYSSKLLFLNNDFEVYDYIILKEGEQEVNIDGIARKDNFSEFYVLAHTLETTQSEIDVTVTCRQRKKHIIYIFNNNNHLIGKIENLKDEDIEIDDFEIDEDRLHVLFAPVDEFKYFTYNTKTNKYSTTTNSSWRPSTWTRPPGSEKTIRTYYDADDEAAGNIPEKLGVGDLKEEYPVCTFETKQTVPGKKGKLIRKDDVLYKFEVDKRGNGNEVTLDNNNVPWVIRQDDPSDLANIQTHIKKLDLKSTTDYRGTGTGKHNRILSGIDRRSKINGILNDDENNIIVLHDENVISILDNDRKLIRTREYCALQWTLGGTYIDLIYDFEGGEYKKYILLIQEFSGGARLSKLDHETLRIVYSKKLNGINIAPLKLTKTVTSYGYLKKIGANKNRFKIVLKKKPRFSSTGKYYKQKSIIDFDFSTLNPGYNHFFINVSLTNGYMELFVNGKSVDKVTFSGGKYALANVLETGLYVGAVSTPFYITLANKLLQDKKYFVHNAKIKGFKIYNKTLNYFDMLAHYNYHVKDKDVVWSYPLGQRTYIDTIDKLFKFNYPEKLSNKYKVDIQHTDISDSKLQYKIRKRVQLELQKITPYFDEVKNITIS